MSYEPPTHCRQCGKLLTEQDDQEPDICNPCYAAILANMPEDILMPQNKQWEQLLDTARITRTVTSLAAIGRYILTYLDGFED